MCYRIVQFVLFTIAVTSVLAAFLPWDTFRFLTDQEATRLLAARLLVLPIFVVCVLAGGWAGRHARRLHT